MRSALSQGKLLAIATFVVGLSMGPLVAPIWKLAVMVSAQDEFGALTFRCDHAMRSHMIAKQQLIADPSEDNVQNLKAMEIGLLDCQHYDLMRKRLIRWGLSENEVSEMSLRAVEARANSLQEVVRIHEIRY